MVRVLRVSNACHRPRVFGCNCFRIRQRRLPVLGLWLRVGCDRLTLRYDSRLACGSRGKTRNIGPLPGLGELLVVGVDEDGTGAVFPVFGGRSWPISSSEASNAWC